MHENGIHDYLKYVKFGYGRATDHACKDIRSGLMSRAEGIEMVRKHDHVKSRDLKRWRMHVRSFLGSSDGIILDSRNRGTISRFFRESGGLGGPIWVIEEADYTVLRAREGITLGKTPRPVASRQN